MSDLVERLRNVSPSTLGHVRDSGLIGGLTPIRRPIRLAGPAVTVRVSEIDANGILNAARAAAPTARASTGSATRPRTSRIQDRCASNHRAVAATTSSARPGSAIRSR